MNYLVRRNKGKQYQRLLCMLLIIILSFIFRFSLYTESSHVGSLAGPLTVGAAMLYYIVLWCKPYHVCILCTTVFHLVSAAGFPTSWIQASQQQPIISTTVAGCSARQSTILFTFASNPLRDKHAADSHRWTFWKHVPKHTYRSASNGNGVV